MSWALLLWLRVQVLLELPLGLYLVLLHLQQLLSLNLGFQDTELQMAVGEGSTLVENQGCSMQIRKAWRHSKVREEEVEVPV